MKRKILAVIGVLSLLVGMSVIPMDNVKAAEPEAIVMNGSELLDMNIKESVGETVAQTRGVYLQTGSSSIGEVGTGKIKAGGTTIAQKTVSTIKLSVIVERLVSGSWARYTAWNVSDSNVISLTSSKTLTVPRGYYYRVRCIHSANSDSSNSNTSGIYID